MSTADAWTGLSASKPASTMSSSSRQIEPHEWMKHFQAVLTWIHSLMRTWNGLNRLR